MALSVGGPTGPPIYRGDFPAKPRTLERIGARPRSELTTNGTVGEQMANPFVLSLSKDVHQ